VKADRAFIRNISNVIMAEMIVMFCQFFGGVTANPTDG
jgi:hypothetical protein